MRDFEGWLFVVVWPPAVWVSVDVIRVFSMAFPTGRPCAKKCDSSTLAVSRGSINQREIREVIS